ncbi:MAG: glutathione S-transferase family protein [bacterium]|nr:glutathione S-transferase family protein [bacterium]
MSDLKLVIGNKNYSSWSMRPWLALKMTGADFEEIVIPLKHENTHEQILEHSPSGWVPVLKDRSVTIWDSLAISEYVGEQYPDAGLWPKEAATRAVARSVVAEMHSGFGALRRNMPMDCRGSRPGQGRADGVQRDIDRIVEVWESCLQRSGGPFLFDEFSLADAFYAPVVSRFRTYGVELDGSAEKYVEAVWEQEHVAEWVEGAKQEPWVINW